MRSTKEASTSVTARFRCFPLRFTTTQRLAPPFASDSQKMAQASFEISKFQRKARDEQRRRDDRRGQKGRRETLLHAFASFFVRSRCPIPRALAALAPVSSQSPQHQTYQSRRGRAKPPGRWERTSLLVVWSWRKAKSEREACKFFFGLEGERE